MKVEVFIKPDGDLYRTGFTIGVQTFYLDMGSEGLRPKEEAEFYRRNLITAFTNLILQERELMKTIPSKLNSRLNSEDAEV